MAFRMFALELQQLLVEKIVIAIAYNGTGLDIVQPVVPFDLGTEKLDPVFCAGAFHTLIPFHL